MNLECEHGQLRRSCYLCELETEIQRLRAALERIASHRFDADMRTKMEDGTRYERVLEDIALEALEEVEK